MLGLRETTTIPAPTLSWRRIHHESNRLTEQSYDDNDGDGGDGGKDDDDDDVVYVS